MFLQSGAIIHFHFRAVITNSGDFWIINNHVFSSHAKINERYFTFVLTLADMTGKNGDHSLRFAQDREMRVDKLDIHIPPAKATRIQLQIRQFLCRRDPPWLGRILTYMFSISSRETLCFVVRAFEVKLKWRSIFGIIDKAFSFQRRGKCINNNEPQSDNHCQALLLASHLLCQELISRGVSMALAR